MQVSLSSHLTVMEQINLLKDPSPAVRRHLVDDLDGVLHLGVDVDAGLDRGVRPLAQHLPGQSVQLLECVGGQRGRTGRLLLLPTSCLGLFFTSCNG